MVAQQPHTAEIPQNGSHCLLCALFVDLIRFLGVDAEGVGLPDLPVIVQGRGVDGLRLAHDHVGQAELHPVPCQLIVDRFLMLYQLFHGSPLFYLGFSFLASLTFPVISLYLPESETKKAMRPALGPHRLFLIPL